MTVIGYVYIKKLIQKNDMYMLRNSFLGGFTLWVIYAKVKVDLLTWLIRLQHALYIMKGKKNINVYFISTTVIKIHDFGIWVKEKE